MEKTNQTINDLISRNFLYASVLDKFGISFYEHLDNTLSQVCKNKGLALNPILKSLDAIENGKTQEVNSVSGLPVELVIKYLRYTHSVFVKHKLPYLTRLIQNLDIANVLIAKDLQILFPLFAEDFIHHIHEEEDTLFIHILSLCQANKKLVNIGKLHYQMERYSIAKFASAHETHDDEMQGIRQITNEYSLPESAGLLWQVVYAELQSFEQDLKIHAQIENEILFPKALNLEEVIREKIAKKISLN